MSSRSGREMVTQLKRMIQFEGGHGVEKPRLKTDGDTGLDKGKVTT